MQISMMIKDTLHTISSGLQIPIIIILLLFIVVTIIILGSLVTELFTERRRLKESIPKLMDKLQGKSCAEIEEEIKESKLLKRQKELLMELVKHNFLPELTLDALARRLISQEELHYARIIGYTDIIARLGPMFGLMGTLIPLGPGLIALGQGDTKTLADSLLLAFDTTVAGLISAAVAMCISKLRGSLYEDYLSGLEALMSCILEEVKSNEYRSEKEPLKSIQGTY